MRDQLDHLPHSSQRELAEVVRILFEEFAAALRPGTQKWSKQGRILKIVLYGSYARGDWVADPIGGYQSDYDLLIVVNDDRLADLEFWSATEDRLMRETTIAKTLNAPVSFIVHTLTDVNAQLERGRPFFIDIIEQGISIYEAEGFCFASPRILPPVEASAEAQKYFDHWHALAVHAAKLGRSSIEDGVSRDAAFLYHQAAERAYHCVLLVLTLYSPKSHRLNFLRSQSEQIAPALTEAWPRGSKFERRCFDLLRQAYVNARYSPHYAISPQELSWLGHRIDALLDLVEKVCRERLDETTD